MADLPRTIGPAHISPIKMPTGLKQASHAGKIAMRSHTQRGAIWSESWDLLSARDSDVQELLAFLTWHHNRQKTFQAKHLLTPGSGLSPNGLGTGTVLVKGAGQTGETIVTDGWPVSTADVVRPGDVVKITGVPYVQMVVAAAASDVNGDATLTLTPPVFTGLAPADNAAVQTTDVTFDLKLWEVPDLGRHGQVDLYSGLTVTVREDV